MACSSDTLNAMAPAGSAWPQWSKRGSEARRRGEAEEGERGEERGRLEEEERWVETG